MVFSSLQTQMVVWVVSQTMLQNPQSYQELWVDNLNHHYVLQWGLATKTFSISSCVGFLGSSPLSVFFAGRVRAGSKSLFNFFPCGSLGCFISSLFFAGRLRNIPRFLCLSITLIPFFSLFLYPSLLLCPALFLYLSLSFPFPSLSPFFGGSSVQLSSGTLGFASFFLLIFLFSCFISGSSLFSASSDTKFNNSS